MSTTPLKHETWQTWLEYLLILGLVIVLVIITLGILGPVPTRTGP
jgi:hypothetical protein